MRIASKINAALFCAFACGTFATYWVLNSAIQPRFDEIERSNAQLNHKRVVDAFKTFTDKLQTATQDYAFWDETYGFVQGQDTEDFITSNLTPEFKAVENLGVNALLFLNSKGDVIWGAAYDLSTQEPIEGLVKEIAHFSRTHRYLGRSTPEAKRGIIRTSKGLLLIAIAPALKGDRSGEPVGKVVSAKLLNVEAAKELTGVDFALEPLVYDARAVRPEGVTLTATPTTIESTSLLESIVGRPLALLKAQSPRDVSHAGHVAIRSAMWMMMAAGLAAMFVLWAYFRYTVVRRIEALKSHFATAGTSGKIKALAATTGRDEISNLATSFNTMADQVNNLRDALSDSAYMSGLSEWAAGTLHNVRNGIVPVATTTWQIEQMFDADWIRNIETAVSEHADAKTLPERRTKLNAFLVGSTARFADVAKRTTELTTKINGASQSVLDIVSEFESYAHRKPDIEDVDVLAAIKVAAASARDVHKLDVDFVLPQTSASIPSNSIILRQVLSNVFINALEAVDGQDRRGRIEVTVDDAGSGPGYTRIMVTDNGEGLANENLTAIFKRGVSTRKQRSGGLGLHWCANAAKVLGGTIRAESAGPGYGATIIIDLPNHSLNQKEAA